MGQRACLSNITVIGDEKSLRGTGTQENNKIFRKFIVNHGLGPKLFPCLLKSKGTRPSGLVLALRVQTGLALQEAGKSKFH